MLIKSPALEKVVAEFGSEEKISHLNQDVREVLLKIAISIGYLRYISQFDKLNLTFNGITFSKFIDEKNWQFNELKLIQEVKNKSQAFALKDEDCFKILPNIYSCKQIHLMILKVRFILGITDLAVFGI
jgi:hypothetical protein